VVKVVLLVLARALAGGAALCLRLARVGRRAQWMEVVELAEGDALGLPIDEEDDF
jgi:hypothetical protein